MFKDLSCGAIVYKIQKSKPMFLLVNSKNNRSWGFPKGHIEKGENELEAANREVFEETGIRKVKFVEDFRQEDVYIIDDLFSGLKEGRVEKHSVYFLALALEDVSDFDKNEISKLRWVDLKQALGLLCFTNQRKFISLAYNLIKGEQK
ncbi:MAG: NUDIX domain-containing protein [Endomicrobium sp.]|jgi:8-oxo-dGTP pyrophosphatase MutT (NUDIX family)|nr:NUDIX domain-containing protein [Endomicrobium sp.]